MKTPHAFIRQLVLPLALALGATTGALAADAGIKWDKHPTNVTDLPSLQRGAEIFVERCLSCHSAAYMRYNRLMDIGMTKQQIEEKLLLNTDKVGDTMVSSIDPKEAARWFGKNPPDLSVIARSRAGAGGSGADYLYTFLRTFYRDPTKATGWDNVAFPTVGMPNVLWEWQGQKRAVFVDDGHGGQKFSGLETITPGQLSDAAFDKEVADLVNYLQWMGEPVQTTRRKIGYGVIAFLLLLTFLTWKLNKAYWREVK